VDGGGSDGALLVRLSGGGGVELGVVLIAGAVSGVVVAGGSATTEVSINTNLGARAADRRSLNFTELTEGV
jgi:hypothetical protein